MPSCRVFLLFCRVAIPERHYISVNDIMLRTLPTFTITESSFFQFTMLNMHCGLKQWILRKIRRGNYLIL